MAERIVYVIGKCALHETPEPGGKVCAQLAEHAQVAAKALRDYADWLAAVGTELADCMDGADEDEAARWIAAIRSRADAMTRQADAPAADDEGGQE